MQLGTAGRPGNTRLCKVVGTDRDMAANAAVNGLGHQVMLGITGTFVVAMDRVRASVGPFHVREDQAPAFLLLLERVR